MTVLDELNRYLAFRTTTDPLDPLGMSILINFARWADSQPRLSGVMSRDAAVAESRRTKEITQCVSLEY